MSEIILKKADKVFREILASQLQKDWCTFLTEEQQAEVILTVAEVVTVYLENMERSWCLENPDRLSLRFRQLVEPILQDTFSIVGAHVMADKIADFSAHVFNQIKSIIDDGADSQGDGNARGDDQHRVAIDTPSLPLFLPHSGPFNFASEEEMDFGEGTSYDTNARHIQGGYGTRESSTTSEAMDLDDEDMMEEIEQHAPSTAINKGKGRQRGAKTQSRFPNTAIYSVIMDPKKPNGPPKHYRCRISSCKGFRGTWAGRHRHFAAKHPDEWEEVMGRPAIVFPCEVDGCDWTTAHRSLLALHMKNFHPGFEATQSKM